MKARECIALGSTLVLLSLVAFLPALGCAGKTATTRPPAATSEETTDSSLALETDFPEELEAVIGRTETSTGAWSLWYLTGGGDVFMDLPTNNALASAERFPGVVYSDLDTGGVHVWRPGGSSPDEVSSLAVPSEGQVLGDVMALSPDGGRLALVRYQQTPGSGEGAEDGASVDHGFMVDLQAGTFERWEWLETASGGDEVTALQWDPTSSSLYVSFGLGGGSQGERSYRHDLDTGESTEVEGVAAVLDVGPQGQVVGLGVAESPSDLDYPTGSQSGYLPLVLSTDQGLVRLPRDPDLVTWDLAWMSDDGRTIVVRGSSASGSVQRACLEVLGLGDAGWEVRRVYDGGGSVEIIYGVAFQPGASTFYFQGGAPPADPGGAVTGVRLFAIDTATGQVSRRVGLPGGDTGRYLQTLSVVSRDDGRER
jgi:hypothetical protein